MALSAEDIRNWAPEEVRAAADAAESRARAAFEAAEGLVALPGLAGWDGQAGGAAREALWRTRAELTAHGAEALAVAQAARRAADSIEAIAAGLARLRVEAAAWGLGVERASGRIMHIPGASRRGWEQAAPLQARLDWLVEQANSVDAELAGAIGSANGAGGAPGGSGGAAPGLAPEDPERFCQWWRRLSRDQRDELYRRDHGIGNHPGIPVGSEFTFDADHYNRLRLRDELARAQDGPRREDLLAVRATLEDNPGARLMLLDTDSGQQVHAAVAVGDPDTATHVAVTTPGLNTTVRGDIASMVGQAAALRREALAQLGRAPGREAETVAAVAWLGYDAPQIPGLGDPLGSVAGAWAVSHDAVARAAAVDLSRFYSGIQAAHQGGPAHLTAVGHSYGSLTTGLALRQPGHGVSDAVFYGSPGVAADTPGQLHLRPGHVFAMTARDDPIRLVFDLPQLARWQPQLLGALAPAALLALAGADLADVGEFGPNPAGNPEFAQLASGPATLRDGSGGERQLAGAHGHSEYASPSDDGSTRTTGYNLAAVVAGLGVIRG